MSINYFLYWLPMIVLAFANAALREMVLARSLSNLRAHQVSTVTLIILCTVYAGFVLPRLGIQNVKQAFVLGFTWLLLTVLFEFLLGRLTNKSWAYLLKDYNILEGHIWLVFLLWLFLLPYLYLVTRK